MDGMKAWYQSKTVWGALIAVGASLLQIMGAEVDAGTQAELADLAVTTVGAVGGLVAIYGRIAARSEIGG
ncbi:hypothetical protein GAO09_15500 [Rhizobiales bacterium RZME27]|jgi:hypothetical protein|uniref:Holin n=1 Tax=Endobacterium cereale TaxID=2663029 RepID=A0A6A8A9P6_9HYPH|nr:hypothetical protein [Endobacterium cereale]MEB2847146.1 hypothetical protein [Endobacterium cereale]MQY47439.1 hypothetical protein [Endobacterium cereale]